MLKFKDCCGNQDMQEQDVFSEPMFCCTNCGTHHCTPSETSNLKLPKKKTLTSIRFDDETIKFMAKLGPVATVGRAIIEKAIDNWEGFEKLAEVESEA